MKSTLVHGMARDDRHDVSDVVESIEMDTGYPQLA